MQSQINDLVIHVYGHSSADPQLVADTFLGVLPTAVSGDADLAIFAINPSAGIDQLTIDQWAQLDDFQTPRLVVVNGLEKQEADFDDAVMIANRVFDQMITPFLVLHDDAGFPIALISLHDLSIIDYTKLPATKMACSPEHETLVQEFRDEYLELLQSLGEDSFAAGLMFPAIPVWIEKGIGVDIVNSYIEQLKN
ncbi:MAG: hypothetical protein RLZZ295_465 [Actinomycetota bacterium]